MTLLEQRPVNTSINRCFAALDGVSVAVLVPCYNEEHTVGAVISGFRDALPESQIYVYDNNSRDRTAAIAAVEGATVCYEPRQGKGHVIARMFADIEADVYVLVDGDHTYDAGQAPALVQHLLDNKLDLVNALRRGAHDRLGHEFGNDLFNRIIGLIFASRFEDMLSGYKVFSRRFVKSFPGLATGFEVETALTVHALRLHMPVDEIATDYQPRPDGSVSKLHTVRDGVRIFWEIVKLVKGERPLAFFSAAAAVLATLSAGLGMPLVVTYFQIGLVPRLPLAVLSMGIMLLAFLSLTCGFILDTVTRGRLEMKRLHYLSIPAPRTRDH